jgi:hypothetical protein
MNVALNSSTETSTETSIENFKEGLKNRLKLYKLTAENLLTINDIIREELLKEDLPA